MDKLTKFIYLVVFLIVAVALIPVFLSLASGQAIIPMLIMIVGFLVITPIAIIKYKK